MLLRRARSSVEGVVASIFWRATRGLACYVVVGSTNPRSGPHNGLHKRGILIVLQRGESRLLNHSEILRSAFVMWIVRFRDAVGLGLQDFLPVLGGFQCLDCGDERLLDLLDVVTTCCQRRLKALLQLSACPFRSSQREVVTHGLFLQPFVTFGNRYGQSREGRSMLGRLAIERVMKLAPSVVEYAPGVAQVGTEPLNILVRRRTCLPEALALVLHFRQSIVVFESFAG